MVRGHERNKVSGPYRIRLIQLSGSAERLRGHLDEQFGKNSLELIPFNERDIVHGRMVLSRLRESPADLVGFGCQELELQRYAFFLKFYLIFGRASRRILIDESGVVVPVKVPKFLLRDLPRMILEIIASAGMLVRSFCELSVRMVFTRRHSP